MLLQPAGWGCCYHMIQCSIFTTIDNNKVAHKGNSCSNHQSLSVNIITISINKASIYYIGLQEVNRWLISLIVSFHSYNEDDNYDDDNDDTGNNNDVTRIFIPTNGKQRLASLIVWGKELLFNHALNAQKLGISCHTIHTYTVQYHTTCIK